MELRFASLAQRSAWLTSQGTITERGLGDLLSACEALELHPRECATNILRGDRPFGVLDGDIRSEANLLFRSCEPSDSETECATIIETKRFIRDLSIGRVAPRPTMMKQNQRTTFTAFIERTDIVRLPGQTTLEPTQGVRDEGGETAEGPSGSLVPYTRETCFNLIAGDDFRIEGENPQCPPYLLSGEHVFAPQWFVTPLEGEAQRELKLTRILKRNGKIIEEVDIKPSPIPITVELEPTFLEKAQAWLVGWTGLGNTFAEFVMMIGTVITAITGLSIWGWRKRRGKAEAAAG